MNSGRQSRALASCEHATPGADLEGSRELREETSTFLRNRLALRSGRESLHRLPKLDVGLSMGRNLAHFGDILLQEMLIYGVSNLQPADECEGNNSPHSLRLWSVNSGRNWVRLETVSLPHSDREEVLIVPLSLLAGGVFGEEHFSHFSKVVE